MIDGLMDECNPGIVLIFQFSENALIENEERENFCVLFQRMVKSDIVLQAQISPEPK